MALARVVPPATGEGEGEGEGETLRSVGWKKVGESRFLLDKAGDAIGGAILLFFSLIKKAAFACTCYCRRFDCAGFARRTW